MSELNMLIFSSVLQFGTVDSRGRVCFNKHSFPVWTAQSHLLMKSLERSITNPLGMLPCSLNKHFSYAKNSLGGSVGSCMRLFREQAHQLTRHTQYSCTQLCKHTYTHLHFWLFSKGQISGSACRSVLVMHWNRMLDQDLHVNTFWPVDKLLA